jgi:hypothetical protein
VRFLRNFRRVPLFDADRNMSPDAHADDIAETGAPPPMTALAAKRPQRSALGSVGAP